MFGNFFTFQGHSPRNEDILLKIMTQLALINRVLTGPAYILGYYMQEVTKYSQIPNNNMINIEMLYILMLIYPFL